MIVKRTFAVTGIVFILLSIGLGGYILFFDIKARVLDFSQYGLTGSGHCAHPVPEIGLSRRTMSENESQVLYVYLSNEDKDECKADVTLYAPDFEIGLVEATKSISVPPGIRTAELIWIVSPKKTGTFVIAVESGFDADVIGVTVLNVLGLSPLQVQLFSIVSSLLGPILTIPWWYEKWKERSAKKIGKRNKKT